MYIIYIIYFKLNNDFIKKPADPKFWEEKIWYVNGAKIES